MIRIPRRVRKIPDPNSGSVENPIENLAGFRSDTAWILLGEPGAGKTTAFQMEAEATGGQYLRIEEFIHLDMKPPRSTAKSPYCCSNRLCCINRPCADEVWRVGV